MGPMSCPTRITAACRSFWIRASVSITCFCTTTSRALVGSSAMITWGRRLMAMAMQARCFMPPLSSWGNMSATGPQTKPAQEITHALRYIPFGQPYAVILQHVSERP